MRTAFAEAPRVHVSAERIADDGRHATTVTAAGPGAPWVDVGNSPHPRSTDIDAQFPQTRIVMSRPSGGSSVDFVDRGDDRPEPISIARCRELLGDEADALTDQDIEIMCRHAETMAQIVVKMFVESRRITG